VRRILGHLVDVQGQGNRQRDEHETGQCSNATADRDEETVPQLWLVDVAEHR
jgi:hypothetical protein